MTQDHTNTKLYSLTDASPELGGTSVWTLRKHIAQGTISVTKLGRRVFLTGEEITRIKHEGLPSLKADRPVPESRTDESDANRQ